MGLFSFIWSIFVFLQSILIHIWETFFYNTRVLYSSETVMMATPILFVLLLLWRFLGPDDQVGSIAMQGLDDHMERPGLVTEETYGGGGNTITGRRFRSGANDDDKKDK